MLSFRASSSQFRYVGFVRSDIEAIVKIGFLKSSETQISRNLDNIIEVIFSEYIIQKSIN